MREYFLCNSKNKEDLNRYLATKIISLYSGSQTVVVTYGNTIVSNDNSLLSEERINNCTAEEADPRLIRHAIHCVERSYNNIVVRTVDTDVLFLLISCKPYMDTVGKSNIYALMGLGSTLSYLHYYDVNNISSTLGAKFCKGFPFFYSFTGCDTVSSFFSIGKCTFWDSLFSQSNLEELLEVFQELSNQPDTLTLKQIDIIEAFLLNVYYPKNLTHKGLNKE